MGCSEMRKYEGYVYIFKCTARDTLPVECKGYTDLHFQNCLILRPFYIDLKKRQPDKADLKK